MLNERIIASVCFSASIGLKKPAATNDIYFYSNKSCLCYTLRGLDLCFIFGRMFSSHCVLLLCFSAHWGESQGLTRRHCKNRSKNGAQRGGECLRPSLIHSFFSFFFLQHHRCVIAENFWWRPTWRIKALQHRWEIPLRWMRWARTVKAADKWFPNPISPTCSTFAREAFLPNKVTVIIIFSLNSRGHSATPDGCFIPISISKRTHVKPHRAHMDDVAESNVPRTAAR